MRMIPLLLIAIAAASVTELAEAAQRRKGQDGPRMEIEPEEWDFGGVRQHQKLVHEFTVTNVGTEDLEILRIATSCGCTAAIAASRVLAPGESTTLTVTLETRKYKGVITKSISLASNDPARVRTVRVKAFVEVPE